MVTSFPQKIHSITSTFFCEPSKYYYYNFIENKDLIRASVLLADPDFFAKPEEEIFVIVNGLKLIEDGIEGDQIFGNIFVNVKCLSSENEKIVEDLTKYFSKCRFNANDNVEDRKEGEYVQSVSQEFRIPYSLYMITDESYFNILMLPKNLEVLKNEIENNVCSLCNKLTPSCLCVCYAEDLHEQINVI